MIAALFVEKDGVYFGLEGVDPWDESRDARLYAGPWPVVAHPPCARWSRLAGFVEARWGYRRGDDGGCFAAALNAVRKWGGVLEHPAYSGAWRAFDLPRPDWRGGWTLGLDGGASCYVEQGRYGLPVKKATWLYAFGVELPDLRWGWVPDQHGDDVGGVNAWRDRFRGSKSRTPVEFRDVLIGMARTGKGASMSLWDDEAGYDIRDPKHPDHYDSFTEYADMLNKRAKEDELVFACEDPESAWIQQLKEELGGEAA